VVTVAAGFPTTVNPIVLHGLVPVFVDVELGTYDAQIDRVAEAIGPRTRAIVMAHTLGNPFDLEAVTRLAREHELFLVEDNCDALGARYHGRLTGTFGDLATLSFYPAHQMTTGEGGCVLTDRGPLGKIVESLRDWGRDCWCAPGMENTCGKRFEWQLGDLPFGYDHKYVYSHVGYNLKLTDSQAAVGLAQLDRLAGFVSQRQEHWRRLADGLADLEEHFVLPRPTPGSEPSWFGFALTVRPEAPFTRNEIIEFLEGRRIATRLMFGGNLTRQPAYAEVEYRVVGDLDVSNVIAESTFWIGVFPGLTDEMLDYVIASFHEFVHAASARSRVADG
jgi:CDP-6-deoxy-D-xylo-4-hexulose-3-dehydrase